MSRDQLVVVPMSVDLHWKNMDANIQSIADQIARNKIKSDSKPIYVFPELTLSGFVLDHPEEIAVDLNSDSVEKVKAIAAQHQCFIVFGFIENNPTDPKRPWNTLALVGPNQEVLSTYRKNHLFTLGQPSERDLYSPGSGPSMIQIDGWSVGFGICFDLRFPDLFQEYRKKQVDLILVSACWVDGPTKEDQFRTLAAGQSVLSQAYVVAVNRAGADPKYQYSGSHYAFAPTGKAVELEKNRFYQLESEPLETARKVRIL